MGVGLGGQEVKFRKICGLPNKNNFCQADISADLINPLTVKLFNKNKFYTLQVSENYSDLTKSEVKDFQILRIFWKYAAKGGRGQDLSDPPFVHAPNRRQVLKGLGLIHVWRHLEYQIHCVLGWSIA